MFDYARFSSQIYDVGEEHKSDLTADMQDDLIACKRRSFFTVLAFKVLTTTAADGIFDSCDMPIFIFSEKKKLKKIRTLSDTVLLSTLRFKNLNE